MDKGESIIITLLPPSSLFTIELDAGFEISLKQPCKFNTYSASGKKSANGSHAPATKSQGTVPVAKSPNRRKISSEYQL